MTHNSRGFYSTHRSTTRDQYTAHEAVTPSVGMKAHDEPRTDLDSHEAVCLQARSVRPLPITHDAFMHGAMSEATLSARRAGRSPMASPACARVRSASNSIKSGLGMGHSGGRATPQARAGCGGSIGVAPRAPRAPHLAKPRRVHRGGLFQWELDWA